MIDESSSPARHRRRQRAVAQAHRGLHRVGRRRRIVERGAAAASAAPCGRAWRGRSLDPVQEAHVVLFMSATPGTPRRARARGNGSPLHAAMARNGSWRASRPRSISCQRGRRRRASAPAAKAGRGWPSGGSAVQLVGAAQPGQAVDEHRAVRARRGVEGQQPRLLAQRVDGQRRAQAQEGRQVDHAMQPAAQVGHAQEPGLRVRHRLERAHGEDLAGRGQRHQQALAGTFERQPGRPAAPRCVPAAAARPGGFAVRAALRDWPSCGGGQSRTLILAISSSASTGLTM